MALQRIVRRVHRERMRLVVLCGHRGQADQDAAFAAGTSKLKWPRGKHNKMPSLAVDVAPEPIDWNNVAAFEKLAKHMLEIAAEEGVDIVWGGAWKMRDLVHFELA